MQDTTQLAAMLNHYLSLATLIGAVFTVLLGVYVGYLITSKKTSVFTTCIQSKIFPLGLVIAFGGSFMTLFYSQYLGYAPCDLCWYQRVFLYPQIFMFAYAWYKRDRAVLPYTLMLSCLGFVIALYHHFLQIGFDLMKPCSSAPFAVDCAKPSFIEFGFVTFPFMAVVLFGFLAVITYASICFAKRS